METQGNLIGCYGKTLKIVPMKKKHLPGVLKIEQVSFPTPWSKETYINEIRDNQLAHYYVCLLENKVVGYTGMWLIIDEAHITTIAVDPDFRGNQLGKILLAELLARAIILGADKVTLEVRPSNQVAQGLYRRMGFIPAGLRKGYYSDTQEDAIIMWKSLQDINRLDI